MLDPRTHAYRADLADRRLDGKVDAGRFVDGRVRRVATATAALKSTPDGAAPLASQLLFGEAFRVFDENGGWSWGQAEADDYVGYVPSASLADAESGPSHRVEALATHLYPRPDIKTEPLMTLSMGARLTLGDEVEHGDNVFAAVSDVEGEAAVIASHVTPLTSFTDNDHVAVAERFLNVPYLWGGRSAHGVDCSSLVQMSLAAVGVSAPRDSDLQEAALGHAVEGATEAPLHAGDLVFWPGHVGIMIDGEYMVHASGHHMKVVIEPLARAAERVAPKVGAPLSVKRLRTGQ